MRGFRFWWMIRSSLRPPISARLLAPARAPPARNLPLGPSHACCFSSQIGTARTPDYIGRMIALGIRKHEAVPDTGSFEVYFDDGRPSIFLYWDDVPSRRLRPEILTRD